LTAGAVVLAGDVGGTKTNLALFGVGTGGSLEPRRTATFHSADFPGLEAVVAAFHGGGGAATVPVAAACFGIAGPVIGGPAGQRVATPNLAWEVDGALLSAAAAIPRVLLLNDLVATAYGIPELGPEERVTLQDGDRPRSAAPGNRVLLAAGTGLGVAMLPWVDGDWRPVASEGGHVDFAPRSDDEIDLLRYLRARLGGRVSLERVLSGPGLVHLYEFLRDSGRAAPCPEVEAALAASADAGQVVGGHGLAGDDICSRALGLFAALYGATAGNLALLGTATAGVFLGGGIAPKILPRLQDGGFLAAYRDKGRFRDYLEGIPVQVLRNDRTALLGAARQAARLLG
jgi:glucokinase